MDWSGFLKIGHRGAAGYKMENTTASFCEAVFFYGANALELDARITKDGQLVVFHDQTLSRLVGRTEKVRDLSYAELRQIPIGNDGWIPRLEDVLDMVGGAALLNIELKESGIGDKVLDLIRRYDLLDQVLISSFSRDESGEGPTSSTWQDLFWLKVKEPALRIALLSDKKEWAEASIVAALDNGACGRDNPFPIYALCLNKEVLDEAMTRKIREQTGCRILAWTANDPAEIRRLKLLPVDGIFSDYPDRL